MGGFASSLFADAMDDAAPEGAPLRRIRKSELALAPPCPGGALRRGSLIFNVH